MSEELPAALAALLTGYQRHLTDQRDLSPHTVRAYRTDLIGLLTHLSRLGHHDLSAVQLRDLRSWLAQQQTRGRARSHAPAPSRRGTDVLRLGGADRA